MEIINFEKKNMKSLTNEQQISYEIAKLCYICKEKPEDRHAKDNKYHKIRDHCHFTGEYRGLTHSLKYSVPKEIPVVFHNQSNYDYHFIIKELAKEIERQFICLVVNTEKYITFSVDKL